jgi:hypothetical protein
MPNTSKGKSKTPNILETKNKENEIFDTKLGSIKIKDDEDTLFIFTYDDGVLHMRLDVISTLLKYYYVDEGCIDVNDDDKIIEGSLISDDNIESFPKDMRRKNNYTKTYINNMGKRDIKKTSNVDTQTIIDGKKLRSIMFDMNKGGALPTVTDTLCWYCSNHIKEIPLGCPFFYHIIKRKNMTQRAQDILKTLNMFDPFEEFKSIFETEGIYCSIGCIRKYAKLHYRGKYNKILPLIKLMMVELLGMPLEDDIPMASEKVHQKNYGGWIDHDDFSKKNTVVYSDMINCKRPIMHPCSRYILEGLY